MAMKDEDKGAFNPKVPGPAESQTIASDIGQKTYSQPTTGAKVTSAQLKSGDSAISEARRATGGMLPPQADRSAHQGGSQVSMLEEQMAGMGGQADTVSEQNAQFQYMYDDKTPQGPLINTNPVPGVPGAFKDTGVNEAEFGKAEYRGALIPGQNPQGAMGAGGGAPADLGERVAMFDRATAAVRSLNDARQQQYNQSNTGVQGIFSGAGTGIESQRRAQAMGDNGVYGRAGYGFGYGPAGVGDDGSGDIYRRQAASVMSTMPYGKSGDREARRSMLQQAAMLNLLGKERDMKNSRETGLAQSKTAGKMSNQLQRDTLAQSADQFGQTRDDTNYQFGVEADLEKQKLGIDKYRAEHPGNVSQAREWFDVKATEDGIDAQGNPVSGREGFLYSGKTGEQKEFGTMTAEQTAKAHKAALAEGASGDGEQATAQQKQAAKMIDTSTPQGVIAAVDSRRITEEQGRAFMAKFNVATK